VIANLTLHQPGRYRILLRDGGHGEGEWGAVHQRDNAAQDHSYRFQANFFPHPDSGEPDSLAQPRSVSISGPLVHRLFPLGDEDFFAVDIPSPGFLELSARSPGDGVSLELTRLTTEGTSLASFFAQENQDLFATVAFPGLSRAVFRVADGAHGPGEQGAPRQRGNRFSEEEISWDLAFRPSASRITTSGVSLPLMGKPIGHLRSDSGKDEKSFPWDFPPEEDASLVLPVPGEISFPLPLSVVPVVLDQDNVPAGRLEILLDQVSRRLDPGLKVEVTGSGTPSSPVTWSFDFTQGLREGGEEIGWVPLLENSGLRVEVGEARSGATQEPASLHLVTVLRRFQDPFESDLASGEEVPLKGSAVERYLFPAGDEDWFRVEVERPSRVSILVDHPVRALQPELRLFPSGQEKPLKSWTQILENLRGTTLGGGIYLEHPGTYRIQLKDRVASRWSDVPYRIQSWVQPLSVAPLVATTENPFWLQDGKPVKVPLFPENDVDVYALRLGKQGPLTLRLRPGDPQQNLDLELLRVEEAGKLVSLSLASGSMGRQPGSDEYMLQDVLPGDYRIRVSGMASVRPYRLDVRSVGGGGVVTGGVEPLRLLAATPPHGWEGLPPSGEFLLDFDHALDPTFLEKNLRMEVDGKSVPVRKELSLQGHRLRLRSRHPLPGGAQVILHVGQDLQSLEGSPLPTSTQLAYQTFEVAEGEAGVFLETTPQGPLRAEKLSVRLRIQGQLRGVPHLRLVPSRGASLPIPLWAEGRDWVGRVVLSSQLAEGPARFMLEARDQVGRRLNHLRSGAEVELDFSPPAPPRELTACSREEGSAWLQWKRSNSQDVISYRLVRQDAEGSEVAQELDGVAESFLDQVGKDGQFQYRLQAVDVAGNLSAWGNLVKVTLDATPPSQTPVEFSLRADLQGRVKIALETWPQGVAGARIYRDQRLVGVLESPETVFVEQAPEGQHRYALAFLDAVGNQGEFSEVHEVLVDTTAPEMVLKAPEGLVEGRLGPGVHRFPFHLTEEVRAVPTVRARFGESVQPVRIETAADFVSSLSGVLVVKVEVEDPQGLLSFSGEAEDRVGNRGLEVRFGGSAPWIDTGPPHFHLLDSLGRWLRGPVDMELTADEPLKAPPVVKVRWPGGREEVVEVTSLDSRHQKLRVHFSYPPGTPDGKLGFSITGEDLLGFQGGILEDGEGWVLDRAAPSAPQELHISSEGSSLMQIRLPAPTPFESDPNPATYFLYLGDKLDFSPGPDTLWKSSKERHWTLSLAPEERKYLRIVAKDPAGNASPPSPVFPIFRDTHPPDLPRNLSKKLRFEGVWRLRWRSGESELSHSFQVHEQEMGKEASLLREVSTNFVDVLPPHDGIWRYGVLAMDEVGNRSGILWSEPWKVDIRAPVPTLRWTPPPAVPAQRMGRDVGLVQPGKLHGILHFLEPLGEPARIWSLEANTGTTTALKWTGGGGKGDWTGILSLPKQEGPVELQVGARDEGGHLFLGTPPGGSLWVVLGPPGRPRELVAHTLPGGEVELRWLPPLGVVPGTRLVYHLESKRFVQPFRSFANAAGEGEEEQVWRGSGGEDGEVTFRVRAEDELGQLGRASAEVLVVVDLHSSEIHREGGRKDLLDRRPPPDPSIPRRTAQAALLREEAPQRPDADAQAPRPVKALRVIALAGGWARLTWKAPQRDVSGRPETLAGFRILRAPGVHTSPPPDAEVVADLEFATSYQDLPPEDGLWTWFVLAVDRSGLVSETPFGVSATVDRVAPDPPGELEARGDGARLYLTWEARQEGGTQYQVEIYRPYASSWFAVASDLATASFTYEPPVTGSYSLRVRSRDRLGQLSVGGKPLTVEFTREVPAARLRFARRSPFPVGVNTLTLECDRPVQGKPLLELALPEKAGVVPVSLTRNGPVWNGRFEVPGESPSGQAKFRFQGYGTSGQSGTRILKGYQILLDTRPPVASLGNLKGGEPRDGTSLGPGEHVLLLELNEAIAGLPELSLEFQGDDANEISQTLAIPLLRRSAQLWEASVWVPSDGLQREALFRFRARDLAGNVGEEISLGRDVLLSGGPPPTERTLEDVEEKMPAEGKLSILPPALDQRRSGPPEVSSLPSLPSVTVPALSSEHSDEPSQGGEGRFPGLVLLGALVVAGGAWLWRLCGAFGHLRWGDHDRGGSAFS
jgi:hypothetical protein